MTITIVWPNSRTAWRMNDEDLGAGAGVEVAGRLVGEDDVGPARQRTRDRDALLLTARQLRRTVAEPAAEADGLDDGVDPRAVGLAARRASSAA